MKPVSSGTLAMYLLDLPIGSCLSEARILSGSVPAARPGALTLIYSPPAGDKSLVRGPGYRRLTSGLIMGFDVIVEYLLEICADHVTLQSDAFFAIHIDRGYWMLAGTRQADTQIGVLALARAVHHTAHDRHLHGLDALIRLLPLGHLVADVALDVLGQLLEIGAGGASAAGAGGHQRQEGAQAHGLQDLLGHDHFAAAIAAGFGRQRNPNGVADALLQEHREGGGGSDDALAAHAGFREPEVQRVVAARREARVHVDQVLHAAHLAGEDDLVVAETQLLRLLGGE